jgi:hypothetical protein
MIKSIIMRWVGHEQCIEQMRNAYRFSVESLKGRHYSEDVKVDGKMTSNWILEKLGWRMRIGFV